MALQSVLAKWKDFFQAGRDFLLSSEREQGLYGELLFLEECIDKFGEDAVVYWDGWNDETHDFYLGTNAVEIKTTSSAPPHTVFINSEYQLDNSDVLGTLFLKVYITRKSTSSGEKLPELIAKIQQRLPGFFALHHFRDKIRRYGYYEETANLYDCGFFIRETYLFKVGDGFPKITKSMIPDGVANLKYTLGITQCKPFTIDSQIAFQMLKEENTDVE